jgi:hypothetical protein
MSSTSNPSDEWRALRELLEKHSPADIATAIELNGVFVCDRYNRIVKASFESTDEYSQSKALDLVADWQAELNDPGPEFSWDHERYDFDTHPTQRFGWPNSKLPKFNLPVKETASSTPHTPKTTWSKQEWVQEAQDEALKIYKHQQQQNMQPKQETLAKDVAKVLRDKGVRTIRGAITSKNIMREALAGDWWGKHHKRSIL